MEKDQRYRALVVKRKTCNCCAPRLTNASTIQGGSFDCDEIGAYSRWQANLDAELMVVGQDFADDDGFCGNRGRPGKAVKTNRSLIRLIAEAGIAIEMPQDASSGGLFFTNAVLCMKKGGMRAPIPASCFRECGTRFLRPTIELVAPKLVVALGARATAAINRTFHLLPPAVLPDADAVAQPRRLNASTWFMAVYHPAASRPHDAQRADWREVGRVLASLRSRLTEHDSVT